MVTIFPASPVVGEIGSTVTNRNLTVSIEISRAFTIKMRIYFTCSIFYI